VPADQAFQNVSAFANMLRELHKQRKYRVVSKRGEHKQRSSLKINERKEILGKTAGRCHICGGVIEEGNWQADHVLAHSADGKHSIDNFLPAHDLCNNYRWHYDAEEFQWILKLGIWLRTQIERETPIGRSAGDSFCKYDGNRAGRQKPIKFAK
jgi:5-methylcytosine-specific restriction endonuclease McrA